MHCKLQQPLPKCSLYAKTFKKTQIPIYDAFGPFPDEPLMTSIDRVLFLFGARKVQKYFNSECPCDSSDCCSVVKQLEYGKEHKPHQNCESEKCFVRNTPTYSVLQKCQNCKCDVSSNKSLHFRESSLSRRSITPRISIKENSCRQERGQIAIPLRALKKSFSLCSLACRKLKEKLSLAVPSSLPSHIISPQWLWTKVESYADGCQVYEIFKNSSTTTHPTKFDTCKAAKIIFVILPTGIIMPFETLPRH
ncbi:uncharacterized protein LOC135952508 [Calliphora vicina]|uniref:uncharacterized protein LOC135952508 n=1 Tax=Calliphora vicina TaxID=7373 RepID=UPI00325BC2F4